MRFSVIVGLKTMQIHRGVEEQYISLGAGLYRHLYGSGAKLNVK